MKGIIFVGVLFLSGLSILLCQESPVSGNSLIVRPDTSRIIYQHPKVFNLEISFEIKPDPLKIDRDQDLKVWIPIPREWDSQKNVQIISVKPEPHYRFTDPEYGNQIFYWDFGKYPEKPSYRVDIKVRLISYQVRTIIDTSNINPYDTMSVEYKLYTRSEHTINISPKVKELAKEAIGTETNQYLQAQKILTFVNMKIHWFQHMGDRSLDWLLSHPGIDKRSGQEYYTGDCSHYSALFVALCRSVGIPARSVDGRIGWAPFLNEDNSETLFPQDTLVSDDGFAGAQHHGLGVHMWAEFYLQDIGWIPADANAGIFGRYYSFIIMSKGRDILLGPDAPQKDHMGYGFQWVPIHDGRVEELVSAAYNIQKIHKARSNVYHSLDPFPTDALLDYKYSSEGSNEALVKERMGFISQIDYCTRDIQNRDEEFSKIFDDPKWIQNLQYGYDELVCHMLKKIMGFENFNRLSNEFENLIVNSKTPIPTDRFIKMAENISGESLGWFFNQWEKSNGLPHLKLNGVTLSQEGDSWKIKGSLIQSGKSLFVLPVELLLETEKGPELFTIWQRDRITTFECKTMNKPLILKVDPDHDILKLQRMPLQLSCIWNSHPNIIIIYGTVSESEANKLAAERFNNNYLGLNLEIIKPDTLVNDKDLNTECVVLFGRPETNKISQRFENRFPIKINQENFSFNGTNYSNPSQGLAQITEHPFRPKGQLIQYAGLSAAAMLQFGDLYLYDVPNSYVIYDADKQIDSGDWENTDADLVWEFK